MQIRVNGIPLNGTFHFSDADVRLTVFTPDEETYSDVCNVMAAGSCILDIGARDGALALRVREHRVSPGCVMGGIQRHEIALTAMPKTASPVLVAPLGA